MSKRHPISMIWAMDRNRLIGRDNAMPWRLPSDLKYFIKTTTGQTVLMGRKTFESIGSKPLPKRKNVIMTRDPHFQAEGCTVVHSLQEGLTLAEEAPLVIMGGAEIYKQFLPHADRLHVTYIDHAFEGTDYFPEFDLSPWREVSRTPGTTDENNPYPHTFVVYERI